MPELPDVEGFRRLVAEHAAGSRVQSVRVLDKGVLHAPARAFTRGIRGRTLELPHRHGKWLRIPTRGSGTEFPQLMVHFGMTGSFEWTPQDQADHKHDRVVFELSNGSLRYRDMRKLTGLWLAEDESGIDAIIGDLGPDAADVSRASLRRQLTSRARRIKPAMMDQKLLAGLGNLCVDEILWRARCAPSAMTTDLPAAQWSVVHARMGSVLRSSCRAGHVPDHSSWLTGHRYEKDAHCPRCATPLRRERTGGRSTVWCPCCQHT